MFTLIDHLSTPFVYLTQSLWRDEAFSFVMAKHGILDIVRLTSQDFNPPLYYVLLHFWMRIFGNSEVAMRSLSFVFHLLTCYIVFKFISKVIDKKTGFFALILTFFNPMLLYFAFEARMYSLLAFASVSSMYFIYFKRWKWWFLVSLIGIYTHLFFWFTILVQIILRRNFLKFICLIIFYIPWLPVVLTQILKGSSDFWVNRIDGQLVFSSLGNIFTSYEGTPGGLWGKTAIVTFLIILASFIVLKKKRDQVVNMSIVWLYVPLILIILISLWKPLFVNRYLIFLVIPIIFIFTKIIDLSKKFRFLIFFVLLFSEISVFLYLGPYYKKVDIRESVRKVMMRMEPGDVLVSQTPLTFFEANYYSNFKAYLYAPDKNLIPAYVGKALIDENKIVPDFSTFKEHVFVLKDDGEINVFKYVVEY